MPRTKTIIRTSHRKSTSSRGNSAPKRAQLKKSRTHIQVKYRGPRISRTRLRNLREDLDNTRSLMSDTVDKFWIESEHDIRDTLARTEQKIGRAVRMLAKAA